MAGKTHQDRELAAKVRSLCLEEIQQVLEGTHAELSEDVNFKKQLLLKLSSSILPRLNEVSGPDGGEIPIPIYGSKST